MRKDAGLEGSFDSCSRGFGADGCRHGAAGAELWRRQNPGRISAGRHIDGMWKLRRYASRRVLKLEAVAEYQIELLGAVFAEVLLEVRRRGGLDVTDLGAKAVPDSQEPLIRPAVPGLI